MGFGQCLLTVLNGGNAVSNLLHPWARARFSNFPRVGHRSWWYRHDSRAVLYEMLSLDLCGFDHGGHRSPTMRDSLIRPVGMNLIAAKFRLF